METNDRNETNNKRISIKLGDQVKDSISGFSGTVIAICEYLYGCVRCEIAPKKLDKEGNPYDSVFFDEPQLIKMGSKLKVKKEDNGGYRKSPSKRNDPQR